MLSAFRTNLAYKIAGLAVIGSFIFSSCQAQPGLLLAGTPTVSKTLPEPQVRVVTSPTFEPAQAPALTPLPSPIPTQDLPGPGFPIVGLEIKQLVDSKDKLEMTSAAGINGIRNNGIVWSDVERLKGERRWDALGRLEKGLMEASASGSDVIMVVRGTPSWAQNVPGYACGPMKEEEFQAFAAFMKDLVNRYSVPPYNVKYWELGNEPDVAPQLVNPDSVYGCWGDDADEFYGGGYYAEMLKVVYPAMKAGNPEIQVLIGGLLMDCDPTNPPQGEDCRPGKFLEGILRGGGGDFFDMVSYHGYAFYSGDQVLGSYDDVPSASWQPRGGMVLGKADYIRELLSSYGYAKPIILTEAALLCPEFYPKRCGPPGEAFYEAQADYVVSLYVRNWAEGVAGTIWYLLEAPGWRHGGLVDDNLQPKPAFLALDFLTKELSESNYVQKVTEYPELQGYEFAADQKKIWVLWSPDGQAHPIPLPSSVTRALDVYGNEVAILPGEFSVLRPIYVELSP